MSPPLRRRAFLRALSGTLAAKVLAAPVWAGAADQAPPARRATRIVALDFGLAETLIEIGRPAIALPSLDEWAQWVVEPALPAGTLNLGADREPNLELLAALRPDLIVSTPYLNAIRPLLAPLAPTLTFSVYAPPPGDIYARSIAATRELALALGETDAGEHLIDRTRTKMEETRRDLAACGLGGQKLLVVNILDPRHVRVYGTASLFGGVLERCGLVNGWQRPTNFWGFSTVGVEALAASPSSRLLCLEPIPADTLDTLAASPLWASLPFVKAGRIHRLPPVLMFGMLPSAMRFAREISRALQGVSCDG